MSETKASTARVRVFAPVVLVVALAGSLLVAPAAPATAVPTATLLVAGLAGGSGSTVGPGGALYVTERSAGRVSRVDPLTRAVATLALKVSAPSSVARMR